MDVNGEINLDNDQAPELELQSVVNGQCTIDSSEFKTISASLVNGSLTLKGVTDPQDYSVQYNTVNGGVQIGSGNFMGSGNFSGSGDNICSIIFKGVNSYLHVDTADS